MCNWLQATGEVEGITTTVQERPAGGTALVWHLAEPEEMAAGRQEEAPAGQARSAAERVGGLLSDGLGCLVYGGLDGVITTFAIVSGVMGARLSAGLVLVLGLANLLGDGFSMATGAYLSAKSEQERAERERRRTTQAVQSDPDTHRHTLRSIYQRQGYSRDEAHWMVEINSRRPSRFLSALLKETAGPPPESQRPMRDGLLTFGAFVAAGSAPLLVYFLDWLLGWNLAAQSTFYLSAALSGLTLFGLGAAKSRVTERSGLRSGLEMLVVGGLAGAVAFGIGALLRGLGVE